MDTKFSPSLATVSPLSILAHWPRCLNIITQGLIVVLLLIICVSGVQAQDTESGNPTGSSGSFNGEVSTAGSYDPFTGNIKRRITDLTVPGANGAYPLAFSRTYNSLPAMVGYDTAYLGDSGNWRHSYQWQLTVTDFNTYNGNALAYTLAYPDGAVVTYRAGRQNAPNSEIATYWRGPSGTTDRLEVQDRTHIYLHTGDGGIVNFGDQSRPTSIVDPYGAVTTLSYVPNNPSYLDQVTEPGGRWLKFIYSSANFPGTQIKWTVLSQIQASTSQTVTYTYAQVGTDDRGTTTVPYIVPQDVSYDSEPLASGASGNVHATYTYAVTAGVPSLLTASDPHYAGAMVNIRYASNLADASWLEEQNMGTSTPVSHLDRTIVGYTNGMVSTTSKETRGDLSASNQRTFNFGPFNSGGPAIPGQDPIKMKASLLSSITDFEGNTTNYNYYDIDAKDTNGKSFLQSITDARGNTTSYTHEPLTGKVTSTTLPDGRTSTAVWSNRTNSDNHWPYYLFKTTDARSQDTVYQRDPNNGLVTLITYPDSSTERFEYQPFTAANSSSYYYKVWHAWSRLGAKTTYTYGSNGGSGRSDLLISVARTYRVEPTNPNTERTETTTFHYDALDRVDSTTDPLQVGDSYTYNSRHQLHTVTHSAPSAPNTPNLPITYTYDDNGNRTNVTDELGHTATTFYDEYRRVYYTQIPVNDGTTANRYVAYDYSRRDNSNTLISSALRHTSGAWGVTWSGSGHASQRIYSPNGWTTDQYDGMYVNWTGPTVTPTPSNGYVHTSATYNPVGQVKNAVDAQNATTVYTYDNCGRSFTVVDPIGVAYPAQAANHTTTYAYYGAGEPALSGSGVNCAGLPKSVTSPGTDLTLNATVTTTYRNYNKLGEAREVLDGKGNTFNSNYDPLGNLTSQADGAQAANFTSIAPHWTGYGYDQLGRKTGCNYPDGKAETWTYDDAGHVKTYTNRDLAKKTYQYDGRNRCSRSDWSNNAAQSVVYGYNAANRLKLVDNGVSAVSFGYDDSGALRWEAAQLQGQSANLATTYTHNLDGQVDSILYPTNAVNPAFSYDNQGRCVGVNGLSGYNYSSGSRLRYIYRANGDTTQFDYQQNGRVTDVWHYNDGNSTNIGLRAYGYVPNGQVSWAARGAEAGMGRIQPSHSTLESGRGDVFYYFPDASLSGMSRDVAMTNPSWPGAYSPNADSLVDSGVSYANGSAVTAASGLTYDGAGNRTALAYWPQGNQSQAVTPPNYTQNTAGLNEYTAFAYDANGNTLSAGLGWTYHYDAEGQLTSATLANNTGISFAYDGLGRLVAQNNSGIFKLYYYAGSQRIEERDGSNNPLYQYIFQAPQGDALLYRQGGTYGQIWYLYDALGNTSHLTDNSGNVVEAYTYDAFGTPSVYDAAGNVLSTGSTKDNWYMFKGAGAYEWFGQLGLYFCRARWYLPAHGRWLQPDPIGLAGGLNLYAYCGNDPINMVDPGGLEAGSIDWYGNLMQQSGGGDGGVSSYYQYAGLWPAGDGRKADVWVLTPGVAVSNAWGRGFTNLSSSLSVFSNLFAYTPSSYNWREDYRRGPMTDVDRVFRNFADGQQDDPMVYVEVTQAAANATTVFVAPEAEAIEEGWMLTKGGQTLVNAAEGIQFTKSSLQLGQKAHTAYKAGLANNVTTFKEFTGIKGIRPDFVDFNTKTIFELKPFNPKSIQLGARQLDKYKALFQQTHGPGWRTVLDTY